MQYFTFLGVGTLPEGYEEALYSFEDNKEEIHASKYVQSAIIEKFQSDISESAVHNSLCLPAPSETGTCRHSGEH